MINYNVGRNHPKFIDLTNKLVGKLQVLDYVFKKDGKHQNRWVWKCQCSCGELCYVRTTLLTNETPQNHCIKCSRKERLSKVILGGFLSIRNRVYRNYKRTAKQRNYNFELSFEQFDRLISQPCYYCGCAPKEHKGEQCYTYNKGIFKRNGVDRLKNSIGYTIENTVACCKQCNTAKMDMPLNQFYSWVYNLFNNLKLNGKFND